MKMQQIVSLLKKRNKVYLLTKNFKTRESNKKLNHIKIDLFFVEKIKELKIYELNLSKKIRVFSVFDILLLKLTNFNMFI